MTDATPGALRRWDDAPSTARRAALVLSAVLGCGTAVHLVQLALSGGTPYPGLPAWLRVYLVGLTLADPLAAVLLLRRARSGVALAVVVLVTDAAANGYAHYVLDPAAGLTVGRVGHGVITLVAAVAVIAAPSLWRHARRQQDDGRRRP